MAFRPVEPYALHWFRRDLRVAGNPALQVGWKAHAGRVLGLFLFDKKFLSRPDFSAIRFAFFLETLEALRVELQSLGGDLLVLDDGPLQGFERIFRLIQGSGQPLPALVTFNRDYEPFARDRDTQMEAWLNGKAGVGIHTERDHLLIEPHELLKGDGSHYQVFTPFARRWFELLKTPEMQVRIALQKKGLALLKRQGEPEKIFSMQWKDLLNEAGMPTDALNAYLEKSRAENSIRLPGAGSRAALHRVHKFGKQGLTEYAEKRDIPGVPGTSQLSVYFKNGSLVSAQVLSELGLGDQSFGAKTGASTFLKEIVWREFYYHILYHQPNVEREAYLEKFRNIEWENNEHWFEAWKRGETGFPIVDAGMRQLNQTGWMHNRVRMIVASFLTKDLLIDWRWGERYFMEKLLDGDLAPNNGGWQWAASTGCDPQPYFRIFNPQLQSERFDPEGDYLKTWIPELKKLSAKQIHEPHAAGEILGYPAPIVDHREQKERALDLYSGE